MFFFLLSLHLLFSVPLPAKLTDLIGEAYIHCHSQEITLAIYLLLDEISVPPLNAEQALPSVACTLRQKADACRHLGLYVPTHRIQGNR